MKSKLFHLCFIKFSCNGLVWHSCTSVQLCIISIEENSISLGNLFNLIVVWNDFHGMFGILIKGIKSKMSSLCRKLIVMVKLNVVVDNSELSLPVLPNSCFLHIHFLSITSYWLLKHESDIAEWQVCSCICLCPRARVWGFRGIPIYKFVLVIYAFNWSTFVMIIFIDFMPL